MTKEQKPTILLIDDDRFLLDMYVLKFKKANLSIDSFSSTTQALEKIKSGEVYDILLLDVIMPTMDGIQLLEAIRAEKLLPDALVVMLTNSPDEFGRAKNLGIDGYIVKATSIPSEVVDKVMTLYKNKHKKS